MSRGASSVLRGILGIMGGGFIENLIVKCLYAKLGLEQPSNNREFHEHIFEAHRKISIGGGLKTKKFIITES